MSYLHELIRRRNATGYERVVYHRLNTVDLILSIVEQRRIVVVEGRDIPWHLIPKTYHAWVFSHDETMYCPLEHERVPRHRHATEEEIRSLPRGQLPVIQSHDIVVRWMGFCVDDTIAIERKDSVYYRRVA